MYDPNRPIRIQIDRHSNLQSTKNDQFPGRTLWQISIGGGNPEQWARYNSGESRYSYSVEIDNSYPRDNGIGRVTRVAWSHGDTVIVVPDDEFESLIESVIEHEFLVPAGMDRQEAGTIWQCDENPEAKGVRELTREEAIVYLSERGKISYTDARFRQINTDIFDRLIDGWRAASQFVDFAVTL